MDLSRSSEKLLYDVAEAVAYEVRAQWNNATRTSTHYPDAGLSCFSPVINIMRHPLWGRNQVSSKGATALATYLFLVLESQSLVVLIRQC